MARESISKIAYKTLQQSKSIAGFAHKQISSRLMNFILPDSKLENFNIDKDLLMQIQNSMDILREEDWNDAEKNIYPKKICKVNIYQLYFYKLVFLFVVGLSFLKVYPFFYKILSIFYPKVDHKIS